jgi:hypothetical protein
MLKPLALAAAMTLTASPLFALTPEQVVQRQVEAYNAHDLDAFVACHGKDIEFRTLDGNVNPGKGSAALRKAYGEIFEHYPQVRVKVLKRICQGPYVIDQLQADGMGPNPMTIAAIFEVAQERIVRVWFIEG